VVDEHDVVEGYLIVAMCVDDVRFFGTTREREKYLREAQGKIKFTIEKTPIAEFVSIETYQDFETHTCELKMPTHWRKAAQGCSSLFKDGIMKVRKVPMTACDEKLLKEAPTDEEIREARCLPHAPLLGVMTHPASNCRFEIKLATSKLGSRRWFCVFLNVQCAPVRSGCCTPKGSTRGATTLSVLICAGASLEVPRTHHREKPAPPRFRGGGAKICRIHPI
jgi:hypothetical protein